MPRPICERLAFSTNAFKRVPLSDAIRIIAEIGYAGCELMADQPHMTPAAMTQTEVQMMAAHISAAGLHVSNVNAFTGFFAAGDQPSGDTYHPTWIEENEAARQIRIVHTCASVRLALALGAKTVSLQPAGPLIGTELRRDTAGARFADGIRCVLPAARDAGVTLAVEPEPGLFLQTTDEFRQWKQDFFADEPLVKMNFDVGHAFCVGEDPAVVAREMAGEYAHIHLEDIAASRVHQHLAPGEGAIDFRALFSALDEVDYGGWITVELYPFLDDAAGAARRAMKHLRTLLK